MMFWAMVSMRLIPVCILKFFLQLPSFPLLWQFYQSNFWFLGHRPSWWFFLKTRRSSVSLVFPSLFLFNIVCPSSSIKGLFFFASIYLNQVWWCHLLPFPHINGSFDENRPFLPLSLLHSFLTLRSLNFVHVSKSIKSLIVLQFSHLSICRKRDELWTLLP